jgi:mannose/fructose/sorbose-specific phosphotransferase system IIA component
VDSFFRTVAALPFLEWGKIMIGVLITTHGNLGNELIHAAESIKGPLKDVMHVCIEQTKGLEDMKKEISNALKKLDHGKGVLILTDLFGGTPSNISLSFMKEGKVEVVTGVNLPMLLRTLTYRERETRHGVVNKAGSGGRDGVMAMKVGRDAKT